MQELTALLWDQQVSPGEPFSAHREAFEKMGQTFRLPTDAQFAPTELAGVGCEWVTVPESQSDPVCLYLHGGGYVIGSLATHRETASRYARALGARTLLVDYRLAPEHPHPAALDDVSAVYAALLDSGVAAQDIVVCGESAGGGLSVALLTRLVERSLPVPACAAVVSPWVDMTLSGASYQDNRTLDPIIVYDVMIQYRDAYSGERSPEDPAISPIFAELAGCPPIFISSSRSELLHDEAKLLVERLRAAQVPVETEFLEGAVHAWTLFPHVPETRTTLERVASFVSGVRARVAT